MTYTGKDVMQQLKPPKSMEETKKNNVAERKQNIIHQFSKLSILKENNL